MPYKQPSLCHPNSIRHTAEGLCYKCYKAANPHLQKYHVEYYKKHKHTKFAEYRRRAIEKRRGTDRSEEHRKSRLSQYSLTLEKHQQILDSQNRVCKICGLDNKGKQLAVDHDHACCPGVRSCGKCVRSLLCTRCNAVLGLCRDDSELLEKMSKYLKESPRC